MKEKIIFSILFTSLFLLFFGCSKEVVNKTPTCSIVTPNDGEQILQGEIVTISVDANDTDGEIKEVRFYVDGSGLGSSAIFPYNFEWNTENEDIGKHEITVTVFDNSGNSTTELISVELFSCDFSANNTEVTVGETIYFTGASNKTIENWSWDFGDGNTSTEQNPTNSFNTDRMYNVTLTVTYGSNSHTIVKNNYINASYGTVSDYDGNIYKTLIIGNQWWMAENLKATHYANGTKIQLVESTNDWDALGNDDKAMCYYDNSSTNANTYGALYTWAAAKDACPNGWHLPTDDEWKQLERYLGMSQSEADDSGWRGTNEGSKLAGNSGLWDDGSLENDAAFGTSGFLALPGGFRSHDGSFYYLSDRANFWSATEYDASNAWYRLLYYNTSDVYRSNYYKDDGFSVRCLKD